MQLARLEGVLHQRRDGHRTDAAGYRRDIGALLTDILEIHIAAQLAVFISVHTDVDNNRAVLDHIGGDKFRNTDRGYQNIRPAAYLRKIFGTAVTDGHRTVFVQQKHTHRLADYIASSDYDTFLALDRDVIGMQHLHHAGGRTGKKIVFAEHDFADVHRVKSVYILARINRFDDCLVIKMLRQRQLNKNTVDVLFLVERLH